MCGTPQRSTSTSAFAASPLTTTRVDTGPRCADEALTNANDSKASDWYRIWPPRGFPGLRLLNRDAQDIVVRIPIDVLVVRIHAHDFRLAIDDDRQRLLPALDPLPL